MSWPSPVAVKQAATANQYNALLASLQTWGGQVDAANNTIKNLGGFSFAAAAVLDATAGGLTILGGLKVTVAAATNIGLTVTSADASRTMQLFIANGAAPALLSSTSNFALRTSSTDTRAIIFSFVAGAEEFIATTSGRLRFTVPLDVDTDIVAGGKVTAASLTVTNSANIVIGANWVSWTPIFTASGAMAVSGVNLLDAQYLRVGPWVFFKIYVAFTLGGTADQAVYASLPVIPVGQPVALAILIQVLTGANYPVPAIAYSDSTSGGRVFMRSGSAVNFALGSYNVMVSGFYRCA